MYVSQQFYVRLISVVTAGLSSLGSSKLVITGGMAELLSGAISMGLGGYLGARSEADYYDHERKRERMEVDTIPDEEAEEIFDIFHEYGVSREACAPLVDDLKKNKENWVDFMMVFELNLQKPKRNRAFVSAFTIGASYAIGGLVPLLPYFFVEQVQTGLWISVSVTAVALLVFGYVKSGITCQWQSRRTSVVGSLNMLLVGGLAAAGAYGLVAAIQT